MPVKRRLGKAREHRITPEAVAAFMAGDFTRLHRALGLKPWEPSPLPRDIEPLGVDEGPGPQNRTSWAEAWPKVQELQRVLIEAAGGRPRASRQRSD